MRKYLLKRAAEQLARSKSNPTGEAAPKPKDEVTEEPQVMQ